MKRIKRFGVFQTAKVAAIIMFFVSLIFILPVALIAGLASGLANVAGVDGPFSFFPFIGGLFLIILPFIYGIFAFISTAIGCLVYNFIASKTGGIEMEFETVEEPMFRQ